MWDTPPERETGPGNSALLSVLLGSSGRREPDHPRALAARSTLARDLLEPIRVHAQNKYAYDRHRKDNARQWRGGRQWRGVRVRRPHEHHHDDVQVVTSRHHGRE